MGGLGQWCHGMLKPPATHGAHETDALAKGFATVIGYSQAHFDRWTALGPLVEIALDLRVVGRSGLAVSPAEFSAVSQPAQKWIKGSGKAKNLIVLYRSISWR